MSELAQDLRYTLRTLRKNAAFTGVILLTLALGIGANTVIYSVVDGLVLHPFPFPDGDRLVAVGTQYPKLGATDVSYIEHISPAEYVDLRDQTSSLHRVVAWDMGNRQVSFGEVTENVFTGFWWGNAFETLEVQPYLGRGMTEEETARGDPVAVLSYRLWANAFGADASLVGRSIMMNGNPYTVVGIMPPGTVMYGMDLWIPMGVEPSAFPRERRQFQVIGRIAEGFTLARVNAELEGIARRTEQAYRADYEEYEGWRLTADTWTGANVRTLRPVAFILLGAVGFVLLLVCTNVASLLLARSATRRQEMALRRAMGAGRGRLVRQALTESVALAAASGALGVGLAWLGTGAVQGIVARIPFVSGAVAVNERVLLFAAGICMLAGVAFGVMPAVRSSKIGVQDALKSDATGTTSGGSRLRMQRVFVGVEVALALVLLAGGGLLVNSVIRMNRVDPGFAADEVLTMRLTLPWEQYDPPAIAAFFREIEEQVSSLPGVDAVGVGSQFPPVVAANVLMVFAGFALIIAVVGIFSVVSFSVADRTREIGLRVALGAAGDAVRWLMVRQALAPVLTGAVVGLAGAVAVGKAIQGFLFGVSGTDAVTLAGVLALLLGSAVLASYLPARRASRLDPMTALRRE